MNFRHLHKILIFLLLVSSGFGSDWFYDDQVFVNDGDSIIWINNSQTVKVYAHPSASESYELVFPSAKGSAGQAIIIDNIASDVVTLDFGTPSTSAAHNILSPTHSDTTTASIVQGDILYGFANGDLRRLAIGAANTFLKSDGTDVDWDDIDLGTDTTGNYVASVATTSPLTGGAGGSEGAALTLDITVAKDIVAGVGLSGGENNVLPGADADTTLTFDATELDAITWSDGASASNQWTFDLSGSSDPTITWQDDAMSIDFFDIVKPDNIDGSVDKTAITDLSEDALWTLNGILTAEAGGGGSPTTLVIQTGTEDYCDNGTVMMGDFDGSTFYKAANYEGPLAGAVRTTLCLMKTVNTGASNQTILQYGDSQRWRFLLNATSNQMFITTGAGSVTSAVDSRLSDGDWHVLAAILRTTDDDMADIEFWIDGAELAFGSGSAVPVDTGTDTDFYVGATSAGTAILTNCMGLIAVYDTALTSANMINIYNRVKTKKIEGTTLPDSRNMADDINTLGGINVQSGTIILDQATGDITATGNMNFGNAAGDDHNLFGTVTMGATGGAGNEVEIDGTTGLMTFRNTAGAPYGECHQADGATFTVTMTTVNVWVEVDAATTNISATELNGVTFPDDHYLLCLPEGRYFVTYSMTGNINSVAGGDQHIESGIMVNGSIQTDKGIGHEQYAATSREKNLQGHTIIDVPANGQISLALKNTTSGSKILTIDHVNITVMQVGGT